MPSPLNKPAADTAAIVGEPAHVPSESIDRKWLYSSVCHAVRNKLLDETQSADDELAKGQGRVATVFDR